MKSKEMQLCGARERSQEARKNAVRKELERQADSATSVYLQRL